MTLLEEIYNFFNEGRPRTVNIGVNRPRSIGSPVAKAEIPLDPDEDTKSFFEEGKVHKIIFSQKAASRGTKYLITYRKINKAQYDKLKSNPKSITIIKPTDKPEGYEDVYYYTIPDKLWGAIVTKKDVLIYVIQFSKDKIDSIDKKYIKEFKVQQVPIEDIVNGELNNIEVKTNLDFKTLMGNLDKLQTYKPKPQPSKEKDAGPKAEKDKAANIKKAEKELEKEKEDSTELSDDDLADILGKEISPDNSNVTKNTSGKLKAADFLYDNDKLYNNIVKYYNVAYAVGVADDIKKQSKATYENYIETFVTKFQEFIKELEKEDKDLDKEEIVDGLIDQIQTKLSGKLRLFNFIKIPLENMKSLLENFLNEEDKKVRYLVKAKKDSKLFNMIKTLNGFKQDPEGAGYKVIETTPEKAKALKNVEGQLDVRPYMHASVQDRDLGISGEEPEQEPASKSEPSEKPQSDDSKERRLRPTGILRDKPGGNILSKDPSKILQQYKGTKSKDDTDSSRYEKKKMSVKVPGQGYQSVDVVKDKGIQPKASLSSTMNYKYYVVNNNDKSIDKGFNDWGEAKKHAKTKGRGFEALPKLAAAKYLKEESVIDKVKNVFKNDKEKEVPRGIEISFTAQGSKDDKDNMMQVTGKVKKAKYNKEKKELILNLGNKGTLMMKMFASGNISGVFKSGEGDEAEIYKVYNTSGKLSKILDKVFPSAEDEPEEKKKDEGLLEQFIRKRIRKILKEAEVSQYWGYQGKDVKKKRLEELMKRYEWGFQDSDNPHTRAVGNETHGLVSKLINELGDEGIAIFNSYAPEQYQVDSASELGGIASDNPVGAQLDRPYNPEELTARGGRIAEEEVTTKNIEDAKKMVHDYNAASDKDKYVDDLAKEYLLSPYPKGSGREMAFKLIIQDNNKESKPSENVILAIKKIGNK